MTLLEIKRDGSHFTARNGFHTSAKRLSVRLLRVIVTLPERLVKSFYPTIPTSHTERAAATGQRSPAGPRRLGAATRMSASLFRRLSAFFGRTPDQDPKAAKLAVLTPGPGMFVNVWNAPRVVIAPPSETPRVSPCEPLCAILLRKPSVYPLSGVKANVGHLCKKLKNAMKDGLR